MLHPSPNKRSQRYCKRGKRKEERGEMSFFSFIVPPLLLCNELLYFIALAFMFILSKNKEQTDINFQNDKNMFFCSFVEIKFLRISVVSAWAKLSSCHEVDRRSTAKPGGGKNLPILSTKKRATHVGCSPYILSWS